MPVYTVQAPDGRKLKIEAADEATAIRGAQEHYASTQAKPPVPRKSGLNPQAVARAQRSAAQNRMRSEFGGLERAGLQGSSFGWADEAIANLASLPVSAQNALARHGIGEQLPYSGDELRDAILAVERGELAQTRKERPKAALAAELVGGSLLPGAGFIGKATSLPGAVGRSVAVGAASGGLYGAGAAEGGVEARTKGARTGAMVGGAVGGAVPVAARVAQKAVGGSARAPRPIDGKRQLLMQEGVTLTPGQMAGGVGRSTEELAKSIPLVRDVIGGAERRGILDLNRAATNRALAPIGEKLPANVEPGHDAIGYAQKKLGAVYEDAVDKVDVLIRDADFDPELELLVNRHFDFLDPSKGERAAQIVKARFQRLFEGTGATGRRWKDMDSDFAELSRKAQREGNDDAVDMFDEARNVLRNLLMRQAPPEVGEALGKANLGWANLMRVQRAARRAEGGVFSPAQLDAAVTGMSSEGQAAAGRALMQDLSSAARGVQPPRIPDSGSPVRALATMGAGGAGLGAFAPATLLPAAATMGAVAAGYSRPVLQTLNRAAMAGATGRAASPARQAIGQGVAQSAPRLTVPGSIAAAGVPTANIRLGGREVVQLEDGSWIWADTGEPVA